MFFSHWANLEIDLAILVQIQLADRLAYSPHTSGSLVTTASHLMSQAGLVRPISQLNCIVYSASKASSVTQWETHCIKRSWSCPMAFFSKHWIRFCEWSNTKRAEGLVESHVPAMISTGIADQILILTRTERDKTAFSRSARWKLTIAAYTNKN